MGCAHRLMLKSLGLEKEEGARGAQHRPEQGRQHTACVLLPRSPAAQGHQPVCFCLARQQQRGTSLPRPCTSPKPCRNRQSAPCKSTYAMCMSTWAVAARPACCESTSRVTHLHG